MVHVRPGTRAHPAATPRQRDQRRRATFYDAGMRVWIGDESNGIQSETTINRTSNFADPREWPEGVTAASWLHEVALRLYPDSKYAKAHSG
jgi:hypothetical protein